MPQPTVLLSGEDAGNSYYFWQWLDDEPTVPRAFEVPAAELAIALKQLDESLPGGFPDGEPEALLRGAFGTPDAEARLARELGRLLIHENLASELVERHEQYGSPVLIRVLPSPSCTRVPWELLDYSGLGDRLVSISDVSMDPPVGIYGVRDRQPEPRTDGGAVYVIDPRRTGLLPLLNDREVDSVRELLTGAVEGNGEVQGLVTRDDLSRLLSAEPHPSRFVYFGHVANVGSRPGSEPGSEPGESAMVLSDNANVYGVTDVVRERSDLPYSRPLSALDLLYGTTNPTVRAAEIASSWAYSSGMGIKYPADLGVEGWRIWPMPSRVALIGCESGGDLKHVEPYGLVMACLNAGAGLVTATRWTIPTDLIFRSGDDADDTDPEPLIELVKKVDYAHKSAEPVATIAQWQREQLEKWLASNDFMNKKRLNPYSPILWASLATTIAPRKEPRPLTEEEDKLLGIRPKARAQTA